MDLYSSLWKNLGILKKGLEKGINTVPDTL